MARRRAGKQRADTANRLAVSPDHATDVALPHLKAEVREATLRDLREHHFVGKLDELANNEFEKLSHGPILAPRSCFCNARESGAETTVR